MNIYDTDNTDDLPDSVLKNIKQIRGGKRGLKNQVSIIILELFNDKKTLNIDEVIVALYRKYKVEKTRVYVQNKLYSLYACGYLVKEKGDQSTYSLSFKKN